MSSKSKKQPIVRELNIKFRAGDCLYYHTKNPKTKTSWEEQGIMGFARANKHFFPDLSQLAKNPNSVHDIAKILKDLDMGQKRILMWTIYNSNQIEQETERMIMKAERAEKKPLFDRPLKFGQPVYINLSAPYIDYINCWFECYILAMGDVDEEGVQYIYLTGNMDNPQGSLICVPIEAILTKVRFKKHRKSLIQQGKLEATKIREEHVISHTSYELEDIPTIESIKEQLEDFDEDDYEEDEEELEDTQVRKKRKRATITIV